MVIFISGLESLTIYREPDLEDSFDLNINNTFQNKKPHINSFNPKSKDGFLNFSLSLVSKPQHDLFMDFRERNYGKIMETIIPAHNRKYSTIIELCTVENVQSYPEWEEIKKRYLTLPENFSPTGVITWTWVEETEKRLVGCVLYDIHLVLQVFNYTNL